MRRGVTKARILAYLDQVQDKRRVSRICRYMWEQYGTHAGATREQLWRLVRAGLIPRPSKGYYKAKENTTCP